MKACLQQPMFCSREESTYYLKKSYDEHPIIHQYPKYPINVKPIQVANDQLMTGKEAIKCFISFGGHAFEIIAYLLPFPTSSDFISGFKTMREIKGNSNYSKLEFKFKKRSIDSTPCEGHSFTRR